ncbi:MAG: hypothetical protein A2066_09815 [Bacteroidetes bacterium GWB2_41_8]|nr:MAG: hypothetical protein A2066_09815 [Bacteroidetes bacterium GWB2_41_8]
MKTRERIISIRKQSKDRVPRENLWYSNESNVMNSSSLSDRKVTKRDNTRMAEENYDPFMTKTSGINRLKKNCLFVVDWQMSDSL